MGSLDRELPLVSLVRGVIQAFEFNLCFGSWLGSSGFGSLSPTSKRATGN